MPASAGIFFHFADEFGLQSFNSCLNLHTVTSHQKSCFLALSLKR